MIVNAKAIQKKSGKDKILMTMLKITYALCGYANVLSFSLTGWAGGQQGYFFVCLTRIVMTLKIIPVQSLSRVHT